MAEGGWSDWPAEDVEQESLSGVCERLLLEEESCRTDRKTSQPDASSGEGKTQATSRESGRAGAGAAARSGDTAGPADASHVPQGSRAFSPEQH